MIGLFGSLMNAVPSGILGSAAGSTAGGMGANAYGMGNGFIADLPSSFSGAAKDEKQTDPNLSGLTNYSDMAMSGLTPPALPNPQNEISGLMSLATNNANREDPFLQTPQGKLMRYLSLMSTR